MVAFKKPNAPVVLSVVRGGKPLELTVTVGTRPDLEGLGELDKKDEPRGATKARLGLEVQQIDPRLAESAGIPRQGALITEVAPGSPAEKAGLSRGMVIVELNHKPINSRDEVVAALKEAKGPVVLLKLAVPGGGTTRTLRAVELP